LQLAEQDERLGVEPLNGEPAAGTARILTGAGLATGFSVISS
jgi:hypothetical protein